MADQIVELYDDEQPERGKITQEHVKQAAEYVIRSLPPKETTERKIKFATSCDYNGLMMRTGDEPFIKTCGNSECVGCNTFLETMNKAFKEEVEKWQFKLYDDGRK